MAIVLSELGLTYEEVFLDLGKGEHKDPKHVSFNPNGRIPTLIDHKNNDFVIWSVVCLQAYHIAKRYSHILLGNLVLSFTTSWRSMIRSANSRLSLSTIRCSNSSGFSSRLPGKGMSSSSLLCFLDGRFDTDAIYFFILDHTSASYSFS